MALEDFAYNPVDGLKNLAAFPTDPGNEAAARKQVQDVFDQVLTHINTKLVAVLKSTTVGSSGSENIGSPTIAGITGNTVYAQIASLLAVAQAAQAGTILPGTVTDVKLSDDPADIKARFSAHEADYVQQPANGGTTGGTTTAYTCSSTPAPTALVDKIGVVITVHADSGASPTLSWDSLTAKPIVKPNGNAAVLKAGGIYTLRYNATSGNFILQGEGASGNATASDLLSGKTASTDAGDITGTMPNNGAVTITPSTVSQTIPAGYHNGSGTVSAAALKEDLSTDITALAGQLSTYTFIDRWENGETLAINQSITGRCYIFNKNGTLKSTIYHPNNSNTFCIGKTADRLLWAPSANGSLSMTDLSGNLTNDNLWVTYCIWNGATGNVNRLYLIYNTDRTQVWVINRATMTYVGAAVIPVLTPILLKADKENGCFWVTGNISSRGYIKTDATVLNNIPITFLGYGG